MSMSVGGTSSDSPMVEMNTTPLIDVMLVLLIMLIMSLPVQSHAVKLDMPQNTDAPPPETQPEVINLEIDFDGTVMWNGTVVSLKQLQFDLYQEAKKEPQPEVHIYPNKLARYDHVATVLAIAQRLGILRIGLVGNENLFAQ
jgi:biopolymer transport protein ExbD